jgi:hypothetical protein
MNEKNHMAQWHVRYDAMHGEPGFSSRRNKLLRLNTHFGWNEWTEK